MNLVFELLNSKSYLNQIQSVESILFTLLFIKVENCFIYAVVAIETRYLLYLSVWSKKVVDLKELCSTNIFSFYYYLATSSKTRRSADILSTLVNIYGSKELCFNEYRALLADRILSHYHCDVERELRYLELLKLRFGEAPLHFCEVMLRDVTESRRINSRIQDSRKANQSQSAEVS